MFADLQNLRQEIEQQAALFIRLEERLAETIVGQRYMMDRLLLGLLADGHVLIEGLPGLAKTTAVKVLAEAIDAKFSRIQFTPDLLPADLIGTEIYRPQRGEFTVKHGPLFANIILADEINRAPAKVQSALLEAMQERQVTIGEQTFKLPVPFLVLATQNPIEQEGTYPLPEAQTDRFMLKLRVRYPERQEELEMLRRQISRRQEAKPAVLTLADIEKARALCDSVYIDPKIEEYIVDVVFATRTPANYKLGHLASLMDYGASPRATIYLAKAAKVFAFLAGRPYVTPQDVKTVGPDVLRHRLLVSYEAEARGLSSDDLIADVFNTIDVP